MKNVLIIGSVIFASLFVIFGVSTSTGALDATLQDGVQLTEGTGVPTELTGDGGLVTQIVNILLFIVGIISVIMLIIGGLRYVISGGNSTTVTAAKNTILYAIVGLLIAIFAFAIINFVLDAVLGEGLGGFSGGSTGSGTDVGGNNIQPTNR